MIGILVALLIIVALVVGAFLILNYDGEKKMTDTTTRRPLSIRATPMCITRMW